jgi:acyl dehydratase
MRALYEMLTGARAFRGRSAEELLSQILEGQPDWSTLPPGVPIPVKTLLEGCLEKDPRKRIGDMSAARFVLERGPALVAPAPTHRSARWTIPAVLGGTAAFVLGVLGMIYALRQPPASAPVTRFAIPMVQGQDLGLARRVLAISPDGTRLAYVAGNRLFIRAVSEFEARPVPGTEGALQPAFSPDGESLAFWAEAR